MSVKRHPALLPKEGTALLIIDVQERIMPVIRNIDTVTANTLKLIEGFKVLGNPIFITEQYPKGLGPTAAVIADALQGITPYQKMSFSCGGAEGLFTLFEEQQISNIVVTGIEAHVCVTQTVLDLLENDIQVYVAADATSSRRELDYDIALRRMEMYGAEMTVTESVLFEMLEVCGTPEFKAVSKIVK